MTDLELEKVRTYFNKFDDVNSFIENYIKVQKPKNSESLMQLFHFAKGNSDAWEIAKFQMSSDTLRLDKSNLYNSEFNIDDILRLAKQHDLSKYKRIMIKLDNKNYEDIDKLNDLGIDICIRVTGDKGLCTLDEFKKMRSIFNYFFQRYSTYNLSNLEKITLAYDYVKFFMYNDTQTDRLTNSRSIVKSIVTGNIVCEGYSRFFCQLLSEMGIKSNLVFIKPGSEKEKNGHVRVIVGVKDEKYKVNDIFAFDPTWDSEKETYLLAHSDGTASYETKHNLKPEDEVVEKMPSDIRYLFFMISLFEYHKYFLGEQIEKIIKYPYGESIELTKELMTALNYDDNHPKDNSIFNYIEDLLFKTKKVEGYTDAQIRKYINHSIEILKQDRFGRFDKNRNMKH